MDLREAVEALRDKGLAAALGSDSMIRGGLSVTSVDSIDVYHHSFGIIPMNDGWKAVVTGPGMLDTERDVATLQEAVAAVIDIYVSRGDLW